ncbi:N-acetyltransferase [Paramuribaculum intestinale]|uniref:N-acetyltransferase n=2 Tax=Paramuribaculum intestinale TaxID=2094151 RepID=UPI001A242F2A|nr:N-acetyltransferase [Paramuribaculum intestinale]MBJ2186739.1 N-acetyltransferase [Muribaculaceae bacterium]MCX4330409.1 N-acetyltransferase [Paramuribaculum intestinale]
MSIEIRSVSPDRKELKKYVKFGIDLYRGNDCYVPPLIFEEIETLMPSKNPAFDFCEAQSFMALRDGVPAGRITAIINRVVNERTGKREARFGFVDFVDDAEVVDALFRAAEEWSRQRGMTEMVGPMGFTDMDHEGMLIDGFDELGTMATIYNYPYYPVHMERMGYKPDVDWVEYRMTVPDSVPDKYLRIASLVERKYGFKTLHYTSRSRLKADYGRAIFDLINVAYNGLYGYSPLSDRQIDYYIDKYLGILRLDCISVVVDKDGKLVAFGISIPSFSRALQRSGGRLWPLGWYHLLKAIHGKNDVVDLMLVAVSPEYQNMGVNAMVFADLLPTYIKNGYKFAESNLELADNASVQLQWQYFERRQHRRRRAFRRDL